MRSFVKIKPSRNGKITLSFIDIGKSCLSREFFTSLICLSMLFAKIKFSRKFPNLQYTVYVSYMLAQLCPLISCALFKPSSWLPESNLNKRTCLNTSKGEFWTVIPSTDLYVSQPLLYVAGILGLLNSCSVS